MLDPIIGILLTNGQNNLQSDPNDCVVITHQICYTLESMFDLFK